MKRAAVAFYLFAGILFLLPSCAQQEPYHPQVAGQNIPDKCFTIDFNKRYNITCSTYRENFYTFKNCKILGYTEGETSEPKAGFSKISSHFSGWIVVEFADGRKAYFPIHSITFLEEQK